VLSSRAEHRVDTSSEDDAYAVEREASKTEGAFERHCVSGDAIDRSARTLLFGAVGAAKEQTVRLDAMPNDLAGAVFATGR
jgi:hypothetical protein